MLGDAIPFGFPPVVHDVPRERQHAFDVSVVEASIIAIDFGEGQVVRNDWG